MTDLIKKDNSMLPVSMKQVKAVDIRRNVIGNVDLNKSILSKLDKVDRLVFQASTKQLISETDERTLISDAADLFRTIAIDTGYSYRENMEWTQICTRLLSFIRRYYSGLSMVEIKLAFELAASGQLDDYLPKDSQGNPDRKHYQQFNIDFFSKILNAYNRKRSYVINEVNKEIPEGTSSGMNNDEREFYKMQTRYDVYLSFLYYKYSGRMPNLPTIKEMLIYNKLVEIGLADPIEITDDDKRYALADLIRRASKGFMSKFHVQNIQRCGLDHEEIISNASTFARKKELRNVFDRMIKEEIQVVNYLCIKI